MTRKRILGWCNDRKHDQCRYSYVTLYTLETRHCECDCHSEEPE